MALLRILASAVKTKPQVEVYGKIDTMDLTLYLCFVRTFQYTIPKIERKGGSIKNA